MLMGVEHPVAGRRNAGERSVPARVRQLRHEDRPGQARLVGGFPDGVRQAAELLDILRAYPQMMRVSPPLGGHSDGFRPEEPRAARSEAAVPAQRQLRR